MILTIASLAIGWLLDLVLGDPQRLPHPIVGFGKAIAYGEHLLNKGSRRKQKGGVLACSLILLTFIVSSVVFLLLKAYPIVYIAVGAVFVFFCLAGTTLIKEVRNVFFALDRSLDAGRKQVARIVGRDTSGLSDQEVRKAALETLAENLSDGVIAPLFWFALLGIPGILTYKMVNTLDSMIGYKTERYKDFGCWAAKIDDVANYVPARLTALLMLIAGFLMNGKIKTLARNLSVVRENAHCHTSPNSGWPEAALAAILNCRFGGGHYYFGEFFPKPFIGDNNRPLETGDMKTAVRVNRLAETLAIILVIIYIIVII